MNPSAFPAGILAVLLVIGLVLAVVARRLGVTWQRRREPEPETHGDQGGWPPGRVVASVSNGKVFVSEDSGLTWRERIEGRQG